MGLFIMSIKRTGSLDQALNRLISSNDQYVKAGVMPGSKYPDGTSVATVAYKNEYGFKNIPSRPFMRTTVREQKAAWVELTKKGIKAGYTLEHTLNLVGLSMQNEIQYSIMSWTNPPNAPATIAAKGFDAPLRQSLLMHDSIKYEVVEGKL
ncbi:putative RNA polymerase [Acinetobacter phage P115]|nr:putative RNA polymerase [Acinetobacter phage P115]WNT46450.1 putative RNA polymerase [Acinetobacter phage A832.1]